MIRFRDTVNIKLTANSDITAKISGKIINCDAYVLNCSALPIEDIRALKNKYGYPIRQLQLEWGSWGGGASEFVVPADDLEVV